MDLALDAFLGVPCSILGTEPSVVFFGVEHIYTINFYRQRCMSAVGDLQTIPEKQQHPWKKSSPAAIRIHLMLI